MASNSSPTVNFQPPLIVKSNANDGADVALWGDPTTHRLLIDGSFSFGAASSGGLSIFRSLDLDETEEEVKGTAGQIYGWYLFNNASSIRYLKIYNATAANVVVGTTTPVITIPIPAATSGGVAANVFSDVGIEFLTAITVAVTTGLADNDTGAPSANDVVVNIFYK